MLTSVIQKYWIAQKGHVKNETLETALDYECLIRSNSNKGFSRI